MKRIDEKPATLNQLKARAQKHGMTIRKYERGEDNSFALVDFRLNDVATPAPMALAQIEMWLDDLEKQSTENASE